MSTVAIDTIDLTLYGCPLHYIKAREVLINTASNEDVLFIVNNNEPVEQLLQSLKSEHYLCSVELEDILTTTIKVKNK